MVEQCLSETRISSLCTIYTWLAGFFSAAGKESLKFVSFCLNMKGHKLCKDRPLVARTVYPSSYTAADIAGIAIPSSSRDLVSYVTDIWSVMYVQLARSAELPPSLYVPSIERSVGRNICQTVVVFPIRQPH